ncbi:MAG: ABC transporter ATP-binding protein [Streptomycetales bacterium]
MSLQVSGLRSGYGRLEVLHGLDLRVDGGELVSVIGANGAGKTTLLRTVSGLLTPTHGQLLLAGRDVTGLPAEKLAAAGLAHVPEGRLVFPTLSVGDNLVLGGYASRRRAPGVELDRVLELFPRLTKRLRQPAGTLSGGEQQMLAIGRGLMARPSVLVLDEPSLGLAPRAVSEIFATLAGLPAEGLTILLVEQNARAALTISDRLYVMDRGSVPMEGTPSELAGDPRIQAAYLGGGYTEG